MTQHGSVQLTASKMMENGTFRLVNIIIFSTLIVLLFNHGISSFFLKLKSAISNHLIWHRFSSEVIKSQLPVNKYDNFEFIFITFCLQQQFSTTAWSK